VKGFLGVCGARIEVRGDGTAFSSGGRTWPRPSGAAGLIEVELGNRLGIGRVEGGRLVEVVGGEPDPPERRDRCGARLRPGGDRRAGESRGRGVREVEAAEEGALLGAGEEREVPLSLSQDAAVTAVVPNQPSHANGDKHWRCRKSSDSNALQRWPAPEWDLRSMRSQVRILSGALKGSARAYAHSEPFFWVPFLGAGVESWCRSWSKDWRPNRLAFLPAGTMVSDAAVGHGSGYALPAA
jgi:hypothetical protein